MSQLEIAIAGLLATRECTQAICMFRTKRRDSFEELQEHYRLAHKLDAEYAFRIADRRKENRRKG